MKAAATPSPPPRRRRVRSPIAAETGEQSVVEREVLITGTEAEANTLLARLAPVFAQHVNFYAQQCELTWEKAKEKATELEAYPRETVAGVPPQGIEWRHLSALAKVDMQAALDVWEKVKQAAREELACGTRTSATVFPDASPWERARHYAMREEMEDGWKPQNGIEHALIDMLAMSFALYLHWTEIAHTWATHTAEPLHKLDKQSPYRSERTWKVPHLDAAEAVDRAHRLADGHNRQFLRVLRQLRDLRRYAPPVIVNNGGQVNVATDGGQQVNIAKSEV